MLLSTYSSPNCFFRIAIYAAITAAMFAPPPESAVPEEAARQGKVLGQESNRECSL